MYAVTWALLVAILAVGWYFRRAPDLSAIPVVGYGAPLLSMITAVQFVRNSQKVLEEGYRKASDLVLEHLSTYFGHVGVSMLTAEQYRGGLFRIRLLAHWTVVVTDAQAVEDIRKAPPNVLSFSAAFDVVLQTIYTAGPQVVHDRSHLTWIRSELSRCNAARFEELREEMVVALNEQIPLQTEWKAYPAEEVLGNVVCQMSNRLFVGEPLCRNREYTKLTTSFSTEFIKDVIVIKSSPEWLKPTVSLLVGNVRRCVKRVAAHLQPIIEQRLAAKATSGKESTPKPNDALQWYLDNATGEGLLPENLALRMMWINFGAIHSPTVAMVFALYHLATCPEYMRILREEVEDVVAHEGWSKAALGKMRKLDSFLKEVLRLNPPGTWSQQRLALQPFTFSNGQTVPAGTMLACPTLALHSDEAYYPAARAFMPWRHCEASAETGEAHGSSFVTTRADFLSFGHGADSCPGRFFAAVQLKVLLAHIVLTYDIRFGEGQTMPERRSVAGVLLPGKADLQFRQRA